MKYILDGAMMKEIDRYSIEEAYIPSMVLMERAAYECAMEIKKADYGKKYIILVGTGNNGGDGVAIARILHESDEDVYIYLLDPDREYKGELKKQLDIANALSIPFIDKLIFDDDTVFIDAVFGIGLDRDVVGKYKEIFELVNVCSNKVVAIDIPSGINSSTGQVMGIAIKANMTVTFGYLKAGLLLYPGAFYAGNVIVKNIGFAKNAIEKISKPMFTMDKDDTEGMFSRIDDSNKGTYGKVLIVAGSKEIGGAPILSAMGAIKSGCGLVKIYTHANNRNAILSVLPEALVETYEDDIDFDSLNKAYNWADSCVIGPGIGTSSLSQSIVSYILSSNDDKPVIIDADAINIMAANKSMLWMIKSNHIFTPHLKEMERLVDVPIDKIKNDIVDACRLFAGANKCTCVLKDSRTIVAKFSERVYINTVGNSGMATAGSGDVLTGIIAAFAARFHDPYIASIYGVLVHGLAGDEAAACSSRNAMVASDIPKNLYKVI